MRVSYEGDIILNEWEKKSLHRKTIFAELQFIKQLGKLDLFRFHRIVKPDLWSFNMVYNKIITVAIALMMGHVGGKCHTASG